MFRGYVKFKGDIIPPYEVAVSTLRLSSPLFVVPTANKHGVNRPKTLPMRKVRAIQQEQATNGCRARNGIGHLKRC